MGVNVAAVEKQKKLLHEATGHFTMIRMLHLADLITELNGEWIFLLRNTYTYTYEPPFKHNILSALFPSLSPCYTPERKSGRNPPENKPQIQNQYKQNI
jgi:hypothetical protein